MKLYHISSSIKFKSVLKVLLHIFGFNGLLQRAFILKYYKFISLKLYT